MRCLWIQSFTSLNILILIENCRDARLFHASSQAEQPTQMQSKQHRLARIKFLPKPKITTMPALNAPTYHLNPHTPAQMHLPIAILIASPLFLNASSSPFSYSAFSPLKIARYCKSEYFFKIRASGRRGSGEGEGCWGENEAEGVRWWRRAGGELEWVFWVINFKMSRRSLLSWGNLDASINFPTDLLDSNSRFVPRMRPESESEGFDR